MGKNKFKKKYNYEKLNEVLYDNNNMVSYINFKSYSLWDDEEVSMYFLDDLMEVNTDSCELFKDCYVVLKSINEGCDLNDISLNSSLDRVIVNLVGDDFIENTLGAIDVNEKLSSLKSSQLKDLLKKRGIKAKGKRKDLFKIAMENIPESEFGEVSYEVTSKGKDFLTQSEWVELYDEALYVFDFNDFYKYVNENQGDMYKLGLDFVDLHIINAKRAYDFIYLDKCLSSKFLINYSMSDYEVALDWELKRFILRLNPLYYSYIYQYCEDFVFDPVNISNIKVLLNELSIDDCKEFFIDAWDSLDLKNPYLSRDDTFDFLERFFSEEWYDLSDEFLDKYLHTADEYFNLSHYFYNRHEYLLSRDFLENAMEQDDSRDDAVFYEALDECHMKDFEWSLKRIDEALSINSGNGRYWCVKAIINFETNKIDQAIEYFKKALSLNPDDSFIFNNIGVCYYHNNKVDDAIKYFKKAMSDSDYVYPYLNLAKIYLRLGDFDKVEDCFNEISTESMDYLIEKGCYYLIRNDFNKALDCFNDCIENHYLSIPILTLKYLALYELGYVDLYNEFKSKLRKLDLNFVKCLESFLKS